MHIKRSLCLVFLAKITSVLIFAHLTTTSRYDCQLDVLKKLIHSSSDVNDCRELSTDGHVSQYLDAAVFMDDGQDGHWSPFVAELSSCQLPTSLVTLGDTNTSATTSLAFGRQAYYLETGKTKSYFSHGIRSKEVAQLLVVIRDAETLMQLIHMNIRRHSTGSQGTPDSSANVKNGLVVQMEPSFWFTYSRIILVFAEQTFIDEADMNK